MAVVVIGSAPRLNSMLVVPPPASPPAALLELKDQDGPIKAQILTAIPLLARNVLVRYLFCF